MCEHQDEYFYFPSVTIGGTIPGNYILRCPLPSNADYCEFCVVAVSNAGTAAATATVSGSEQPADPQMTANVNNSFSDQTFIRGIVYRLSQNQVFTPATNWERIVDPQGRIFVTLGTGAIGAPVQGYVSIKVRAHIKKAIPKPFVTVQPHEEHQYNAERERRIQEAVWGHEGEQRLYGEQPGEPSQVRSLATGTPINSNWPFKRKHE